MLIGLDGSTWTKLRKWMEDGELPTMRTIYANYVHGNLQSTIPSYTSPALPTLFTGKNQAKTGIFGFFYADGTPVSLRTINDFKLWNILDMNGKSSCIVNVRMLYPVEKVNGIMISGNPATSEESDYVFPRELKDEIRGFRHERINNLSEELTVDPQKNKAEILNYRITMTRDRYETFKRLNQKVQYDFSFFWIGGTDFMGHWYWDDDETFLRYFKEVDIILRDLLETFKDINTIIISDHGMQGVQKYKFYVNTWLEQNGYLRIKGNLITKFLRKAIVPKISFILSKENKERVSKLIRGFVPNSKDSAALNDNRRDAIKKLEYNYMHGIDWPNTRAYLTNEWGISILGPKDSNGYERDREGIINRLKELRDVNGNKIIKNVWKKEDFFDGPYLEQIPDIVFITTEDYGTGSLPSLNITGSLNKDSYGRGGGRFFRGDHEGAIDGILMACGPDIRKGFSIENARIMDIMPTILHMLDVDAPNDIDGRVLKELFEEKSEIYKRDARKRDYTQETKSEVSKASESENEAIIKSLKQMGYIS